MQRKAPPILFYFICILGTLIGAKIASFGASLSG
jgi:xanthosine utilization system XapX-like protein